MIVLFIVCILLICLVLDYIFCMIYCSYKKEKKDPFKDCRRCSLDRVPCKVIGERNEELNYKFQGDHMLFL